MARIDLIIPAYNEESRIERTLSEYVRFFDAETVHIIVSLNGCRDNTKGVVESVASAHPSRITILNEPKPIGKGMAIIRGWKAATAKIVGFVDADGATPPSEYAKLIPPLDQFDGAIASRFLSGSVIHSRTSAMRTVMSHGFIALVKILFHMPFRDTQCGAKLFHRSTLDPILDSIQESGMVFDVELLWRLQKRNASIIEMPTEWTDQPGSASLGTLQKFTRSALSMFIGVLRLRLTV